MLQCVASPVRIAYSTTFLFSTGNVPGIPEHTSHTWVFGSPPNCVGQEQKIFVLVASSVWTSRPITIS